MAKVAPPGAPDVIDSLPAGFKTIATRVTRLKPRLGELPPRRRTVVRWHLEERALAW
jgi:hypothetical protein